VPGCAAGCTCIHRLVKFQLWQCDKVPIPLSSHGELPGGGQSVGRQAES